MSAIDGISKNEPFKDESVENDWKISCSDEETYGFVTEPIDKQWIPSSTGDIIRLYNALEEKKELKLEWKCPGRRAPSPEAKEIDSNEKETLETEDSNEPRTAFDFDDMFNETTTVKITPRRTPGVAKPKGSGQKRVASFQNVMFDMRRQMRLERLDNRRTPIKKTPPTAPTTNSDEESKGNQ